MRQIKFRAWLKEEKILKDVDSLHFPFTRASGKHITIEIYSQFEWRSIDDVELMQYTGLRDINEKEIYEGDIVTSEQYPFQDEGDFNYHAVIEWCEETAAFIKVFHLINPNKRGISDGIGEPLDNASDLIVIGNTYANPYLLEVNQ